MPAQLPFNLTKSQWASVGIGGATVVTLAAWILATSVKADASSVRVAEHEPRLTATEQLAPRVGLLEQRQAAAEEGRKALDVRLGRIEKGLDDQNIKLDAIWREITSKPR